jgi:polyisoprenoid-binding protein YceI
MSAQPQMQPAISTWNVDPVHSVAEFKVKHMMISHVKGHFTKISGALSMDESDVTKSSVEVTIDASSITTRDPQRDAHLQSADFFDVKTYPAITFKSTKITRKSKEELTVEGNLTIHGTTRIVTLAVEGPTPAAKDPWGNMRIGMEAETKIRRKDFGLEWNSALETGGVLVGEEVIITLDVQFVKA